MSKNFFVDILMNGVGRVKNLLDPVDPQDAATKAYVDPVLDGTNADLLHKHSELHTPDESQKIVQVDNTGRVTIGTNNEIVLDPDSNSRMIINDPDSSNSGQFIINNSEMKLRIDPGGVVNNSQFKVTVDDEDDLFLVNPTDARFHKYDIARNDGPSLKDRVAWFDPDGRLRVGPLRQCQFTQLSGRFEIDSDGDWASWSDPNFGPSLQDWDLDLADNGPNQEPAIDWDGMGLLFPAGATLKRVFIKVRGNSTDIDTVEFFARAHDVDLLAGNPIDSNAEIGAVNVTPTAVSIDLDAGLGSANDVRGFEVSLNDYTFNNAGDLHFYMREQLGSLTGNRQLRCTLFIKWELPIP